MNVTDITIILVVALIFALLDKKVTWLRLGKLYRESFWQNFIINAVVIGILYYATELIF